MELGADVLPEEVPGGQSLIAVCEPLLLSLLLVPLLAPPPGELPLEFGAFEAELPGPQSMLCIVVLEVPGLLGLVMVSLFAPSVAVCAMAAVPNVKAMTDATVRSRRFIGVSSE